MPPHPTKVHLVRSTQGLQSALWTLGVFSGVLNLLLLAPSLYMLQVYDRVLVSRNTTTLWMLTGLVLGVYILSSLLDHARALVANRLVWRWDHDQSTRIYRSGFELNQQAPQAHATQPLNDLAQVRQFLSSPAVFAFFDAPWLPVYLVVVFLFNTQLGWLALLGTAVLAVLAWLNEKVTNPLQNKSGKAQMAAQQWAAGTWQQAETVSAMGMGLGLESRWQQHHDEAVEQQMRAASRAAAVGALTKGVRLTLQSLVLGLGAWLVLQEQITPGMMIAASILMGRALSPMEQLISVWRQWEQTRSAHTRLKRLLSGHPPSPAHPALPQPSGRVSVDIQHLVPPGQNNPVLTQIRFQLEPGDVLGVLGTSGSGKSSLLRTLAGVWRPQKGDVRLDGAEPWMWPTEQRALHMGYLPQEVAVLSGTVAENIARFGAATAESVMAATQAAGIHDLVLRMPKGYDTPLGEGGLVLSGGQKQRLGLARALHGQPRWLFLDEPNAHLDDAGEAALVQAVQKAKQMGCTTVLTTHRASTLAVTNKLLVLRDGTVQAFGPRDAVLAALAQAQKRDDA